MGGVTGGWRCNGRAWVSSTNQASLSRFPSLIIQDRVLSFYTFPVTLVFMSLSSEIDVGVLGSTQ